MLTESQFMTAERPAITGIQSLDDIKDVYTVFSPDELDRTLYEELRPYFKRIILDTGKAVYVTSIKPVFNPPERIVKEASEIGDRMNEKGYHRIEDVKENKAVFVYSDGSEHFLERVREININSGLSDIMNYAKQEKEERRKVKKRQMNNQTVEESEREDKEKARRIRGYETDIITGSTLDIMDQEKARREGVKKKSLKQRERLIM